MLFGCSPHRNFQKCSMLMSVVSFFFRSGPGLQQVRGPEPWWNLGFIFPGQGVGLGFFYAYRRSNTRTCHSMGSADLASVSIEKFRCFDGVGRIPVRQLHTPGDGHLVCVGQTISKTRGPPNSADGHRGPGPPNWGGEKVVDFTMGFW